MKLATFEVATAVGPIQRVGVSHALGLIDATAARIAWNERRMSAAAAERIGRAQVPPHMLDLIATGDTVFDWIAESVEEMTRAGITRTHGGVPLVHAEGSFKLLAPVPRPAGVANFSVWPAHTEASAAHGFNLKRASEESGIKPYWKGNPDSYVGTDSVLEYPPYAKELDVECELVCIVGTGGKDLDVAAAERAIAEIGRAHV